MPPGLVLTLISLKWTGPPFSLDSSFINKIGSCLQRKNAEVEHNQTAIQDMEVDVGMLCHK